MYPVSSKFHDMCRADGREVFCKVTFNGQTTLDGGEILEITMTERMDAESGVSIGASCASDCKIKIYKQTQSIPLTGGFFVPYVGFRVGTGTMGQTAIAGQAVAGRAVVGVSVESEDTVEWVPLGRFYIPTDGVDDSGSYFLEISGYDQMSSLTADYAPSITFPAAPAAMLADVCSQCHITPPSVSFPDMEIPAAVSGTLRQQLGWLAGLAGCNARFDRDGALRLGWYIQTGMVVDGDMQYMDGFTVKSEGLFAIRSITSGTGDNPITSGSGIGIRAENPYMTQQALDAAFDIIGGASFAQVTTKYRCDPSIEAGDIISVEGDEAEMLPVFVREQNIHIQGGMAATITCSAPADAEYTMAESPTEQKIKKAYRDLTAAMQAATQRIIGAQGGYYEITYNADGYPTGWILRDTPTITPSTRMWMMTIGGMGYSRDGGNTVSGVAFTMDGAINADMITVGQLSANRISVNGQTLSDFIRAEIDEDGHPVISIGSSASEIILKEYNDRIGFFAPDGTLLAYFANNAFELVELSRFRIGPMSIAVQPNSSVSFVGAD